MNTQMIKNAVLESENFKININRESETASIERLRDNNNFLKIFTHKEVEELKDLLWQIAYDKLLVNGVKYETEL